ncbi:MAG: response regulator [Verrucomicrobiota bacterium]
MAAHHKIIILDDEPDLVELYKDLLSRLPSQPEVHAATSGARALALLEAEPFSLLLTDLNMPGMDGFQVLTLVRRRFPGLRTVVMSSLSDEQYRSRAYAMGIDLFLEKPRTQQEIQVFSDCIESLLEREEQGGFRGVQSKSLSDLIQLECLSLNSSVLKITNRSVEARIWINDGNVIDSEVGDLKGAEAFKTIMGWKTGNFEMLPADGARERTIFESYQGLLLDTAQALDEAQGAADQAAAEGTAPASALSPITRCKGVEYVLKIDAADPKKLDAWGVENPEKVAAWVHQTMQTLRTLGEKLVAGPLNQVECLGLQRHVAMLSRPDAELCVGLQRSLSHEEIRETMKDVATKWGS